MFMICFLNIGLKCRFIEFMFKIYLEHKFKHMKQTARSAALRPREEPCRLWVPLGLYSEYFTSSDVSHGGEMVGKIWVVSESRSIYNDVIIV
jgi:hypothetical protein